MRKNLLIVALAAVLAPATLLAQPQQPRPQMPEADYQFTVIKQNPITSIKNQASSSTCWCFSAIAFLESEVIRIKGTGGLGGVQSLPHRCHILVVKDYVQGHVGLHTRLPANPGDFGKVLG